MGKLVLGGGIGGLSAAYYLARKFCPETITVLEATNRTGGWIKSTSIAKNVIFEQGPRTLRPTGAAGMNTLDLLEDLGLEPEIVPINVKHPAVQNRMVYANGQLHTLPSRFRDLFRRKTPFSKPLIYYAVTEMSAPTATPRADESIYSFVERRLGKEIADYAISPLVCGIYAGDAKNISVKSLMANVFINEQKYGSITMGFLRDLFGKEQQQQQPVKRYTAKRLLQKRALGEKWKMYSLKDGLELLPRTLEQLVAKRNVQILTNSPCTNVKFLNDRVYVKYPGSEMITKHLISALPAHRLACLIEGHAPLVELLASIPTVDICVVNLHFNEQFPQADGFGLLVCPSENLPLLGIIFDSCYATHKDATTLTVMMGGHWFKKYFGADPSEEVILNTALNQIKNILSIETAPARHQISVLRACIPQYIVGHTEIVKSINDYIRTYKLPLFLCGSSYYGVGVNDVILSARNCVNQLHDHVTNEANEYAEAI